MDDKQLACGYDVEGHGERDESVEKVLQFRRAREIRQSVERRVEVYFRGCGRQRCRPDERRKCDDQQAPVVQHVTPVYLVSSGSGYMLDARTPYPRTRAMSAVRMAKKFHTFYDWLSHACGHREVVRTRSTVT